MVLWSHCTLTSWYFHRHNEILIHHHDSVVAVLSRNKRTRLVRSRQGISCLPSIEQAGCSHRERGYLSLQLEIHRVLTGLLGFSHSEVDGSADCSSILLGIKIWPAVLWRVYSQMDLKVKSSPKVSVAKIWEWLSWVSRFAIKHQHFMSQANKL